MGTGSFHPPSCFMVPFINRYIMVYLICLIACGYFYCNSIVKKYSNSKKNTHLWICTYTLHRVPKMALINILYFFAGCQPTRISRVRNAYEKYQNAGLFHHPLLTKGSTYIYIACSWFPWGEGMIISESSPREFFFGGQKKHFGNHHLSSGHLSQLQIL